MDNSKEILKSENNFSQQSVILRYIEILLTHKKFLIISVLTIIFIISFLLFFIIKPLFYSSAVVKASAKSSGISGLLSGGNLPDIGGLEELSGGGATAKELSLYTQILLSRRCVEETIIKFNLMEVYDEKYMQNAVKIFRENVMDITKDTKSGTLEIGIFDPSPERARDIANFLVEQLNKINIEMNVLNAKTNREFIEERYNIVKKDLASAEDSLKMYQDIYGIAPDIVVKAVTQSEITLEAEIKSEEVKLELLKKILTPDQSEVKGQEDKITLLKKQLFDIQNSTDGTSKLQLKGTPDLVLNYLRLTRNVEIQNKILTYLVPIFEQAKIEEKKEMPSVIILDQPNVPELKKKPKRMTVIFLSFLISVVIISFSLILYESLIKELIQALKRKNA